MIERHALFSPDRQHRLRLIRIWNASKPRLVVCGKNPSKADQNRDDPTTRRVMTIAERLGFGSTEMVNADTFITASPEECAARVDEIRHSMAYQTYRQRSLKFIIEAAAGADLFIAAWGAPLTSGLQGHWFLALRDHLDRAGIALHHLGLTRTGWPKHPLARGHHRIPDDIQPTRWTA